SRLLHFQPGYLYGLIIGLAFATELANNDSGRLAAASTVVMLAAGMAAWLGWAALQHHAAASNPGLVVVVADTALATVVVTCIESAVITLLPIRFMAGATVVAWSRPIWAAMFAVSG